MKTPAAAARSALKNFCTMARWFSSTFVLACAAWATAAFSAPGGELDAGFGDHGRILLRDHELGELRGVTVFVDPPSGKLLALGSDSYIQENALIRFNDDGTPDASFGDEGVLRLDLGDDHLDVSEASLLPDGKLLVAGVMNSYGSQETDSTWIIHASALLARYLPDGTLDPAFGSNGRTMLDQGGVNETFGRFLLQADGRIVVLGNSGSGKLRRTGSGGLQPESQPAIVLARYTKDGLPDASFGQAATPGLSKIDVEGMNAYLATLVQQDDGKFLACGSATSTSEDSTAHGVLVLRLHANGLRDATFGTDGMIFIERSQDSLVIDDCLLLADGHLAITGTRWRANWRRGVVYRLTPEGALDMAFGTNGVVVFAAEMSAANTMLLMGDGMLAIAGSQAKQNNDGRYEWFDMLVTRIDPATGAVDPGFGNHGFTIVDFSSRDFPSVAGAANLLQQADGKLLVVGSQVDWYDWYPEFNLALARIDPYGAGSNGWAGLGETHHPAVSTKASNIDLRVRRTGGSTGTLSVDFRTVDGTALAGADYVGANGTLTWLDGDMTDKMIQITTRDIALTDDTVHFSVELFNSSGGLAIDRTMLSISSYVRSGGTPVGSGGANNGGGGTDKADSGGGGAIGIELSFLLLLALLVSFGAAPRSVGRTKLQRE
ncbi:MAG TPA: Calx-beta domain-containing protein [Woeseiaceae bacterium]|nr:Calx-beta domain-containing protein [Woeseiaceae bacterium]